MSAYSPQYYHNYYYQNYLDSNKQQSYYRNDKEYFGQLPFFPSYYSRQARYQTTFSANPNYSLNNFNQYTIANSGAGSANQYDNQNRQQYTWPYLKKTKKHQWKSPDSAFPLSTYSRSYPSNYNARPEYYFEKEIRYIPYPVYGSPGISNYPSNRRQRYPNLSSYPYPSLTNMNYLNYQNVSQLPPKIRVIFIPPSASPPQQSCYAAPAMPPFLFNRMSQPFCSLPLPPPLPQISSLPLTPGIQQMVMKQYSNPMAILPFTSNYQSFPPNYSVPPVVSQQPPIMPPSAAQPYQYASQPCAAAPVPASNNVPVPSYHASSSSTYPNADASVIQPANNHYPSTCRACIPAPPSLNISVAGHCWIQHCSACHHIPGNASNPNVRPDNHGRMTPLLRQPTVAQHVQRGNNTHQHYPHVNTNRSEGSRSNNLPPLPPGAVIISDEYITRSDLAASQQYNQKYSAASQQYSPKYPGAPQQYSARYPAAPQQYSLKDLAQQYKQMYLAAAQQYSPKYLAQHPRVGNSVPPSEMFPTYSINKNQNSNQTIKNPNNNTPSIPPHRDLSKMRTSPPRSSVADNQKSRSASSESLSDQSTSSADTNTVNHETHNRERNLAQKQLTAMSRMINLRYRHQTPETQSIYQSNEQSKSSDDDDDDRTSAVTSTTQSIPALPSKIPYYTRPQSVCFGSRVEHGLESILARPFTSYLLEKAPERRTGALQQLRKLDSMTNSASSLNTTSATANKHRDSVSATRRIKSR